MKLPGQLEAEYAIKGGILLVIALFTLAGMVGCSVQTARVDGFQVPLPLIGKVGPEGWRPKALRFEIERDDARDNARQQAENHRKTKDNYRSAQAKAAAEQRAYVQRVELQRKEAVDEATSNLRRERDSISAKFERMRDNWLATNRATVGSDAGAVRVSLDPDDRPEPVEEAGCYGLSGTRPVLVQLECDRIASEQAAQLDALIDVVEGLSVD